MRSVRTVIRSSAVLIAVLYATVSVHAGGQGGYGAFNSDPYGYPGDDGNSATGMGGDGGQGYVNPSPGGAGGTVGSLITSPTTIISNITGGRVDTPLTRPDLQAMAAAARVLQPPQILPTTLL